MKLAFSTLGCPGWQWKEIFAAAKDLGLDGIELRGIDNEIYTPKAQPFLEKNIKKTVDQLNKASIKIPIVTSGAIIGTTDANLEIMMKSAKEHIDLAHKLSCPYVRVLATPEPRTSPGYDRRMFINNYKTLCEYGRDKNVAPLFETNGQLADTNEALSVIKEIDDENSGILWDIHHPFRFFGEAPEVTCCRIGQYIKHVHVKDSIMNEGEVIYRMMGYGDVPVLDMLSSLMSLGYDKFISLEWVKRWNPELEEPGIVFAHYKAYMDYLILQTQ